MKSETGLSLLECCVSLAIITCLCLVSYHPLSNLKHRLNFKSEVNALLVNIQKARLAAYKYNSYSVIRITPYGYTIHVDNKNVNWQHDQDEALIVCRTLPETISIGTNFTKSRTRYRPRPGSMKAGSIFLADNDGNRVRIVINILGRVRWQYE